MLQCVYERDGEIGRKRLKMSEICCKVFLSDQIQTSIRSIIFSFAPASAVFGCVCARACVCVCVCVYTLLLWRPSEGMSRSVSVCLCSPILSLTLCDNRFYHTVHFCVFVCARVCVCVCMCWSVYAVQSLSSTVIFKVFVQRWRSDAIW